MPVSSLIELLNGPNTRPTISPNTADANDFGADTTPTLEFTGTDLDAEDLRYEVLIDPANTFDSSEGTEAVDQQQAGTGTGFGFGEFANVRYRGQVFTAGASGKLTKIGFNRSKGSYGLKVYFDTVDGSNLPAHSVGSELYSFTIPNADIVDGYGEYVLPADFNVVAGTKYCFYLAPWDTVGDAYHDDYQDCHGSNSSSGGVIEITFSGGSWSTENLCFNYKTYVTPVAPLLDKISGTDSGFANTVTGGDSDPFNSGEKISFTVQGGDALSPGTYYWKARVKDPNGTNIYSDWTTTRSFIIATAANSARSARITGTATGNDTRSARVTGKETSNDNRGARVTGIELVNDTRGARISGVDTASNNRGGRITGANGSNDNRGARLTGTAADNSSRSARVAGKLSDSSDRGGRVTGKDSATDTRTGRIAGRAQGVDTRGAMVSGRETANASRGGQITGNANVSDARGGRVTGTATTSNERGARISGKNTLQESRGGRITGTDNATATREARISGRATAEDIMAGRIAGKDTKTDAREARVTGSITETDQREARVSGQDVGFDTIGARVAGKETAEDVRGARITGFIFETVFNVRGATITGVRRNPYTKKQAQYSDSEEKYQARVSPYTGW